MPALTFVVTVEYKELPEEFDILLLESGVKEHINQYPGVESTCIDDMEWV